MHTLVVGATGYLGRHLVASLHTRGHTVRAVARERSRAEQPGAWGAPALRGLVEEWAIGTVEEPDFTADLAVGVDAAVSALGVTTQRADPWDVDYRGNLAVLESAERHGVGRFCYIDVLGGERCPTRLTSAKTAFAEKLAGSSTAAQIVSPPAYFSDMARVLELARRGHVYLLDPGCRVNPIHGIDLAEACIDRLESGTAGRWDIGGPEVFSWQEVAECAFAALGTSPKVTTVPPGLVEWITRMISPWSPRRADMLRFIAWGMRTDCVGDPTGTRRLSEFFSTLTGEDGARGGGAEQL